MIHLDFTGKTVEGQVEPHEPGTVPFSFRAQVRVGEAFVGPILNGRPLEFSARARNRSMGQDTTIVSEYDVVEAVMVRNMVCLLGSTL